MERLRKPGSTERCVFATRVFCVWLSLRILVGILQPRVLVGSCLPLPPVNGVPRAPVKCQEHSERYQLVGDTARDSSRRILEADSWDMCGSLRDAWIWVCKHRPVKFRVGPGPRRAP